MTTEHSVKLARRAQAVYEQRLKTQLEATHPDDFVAIEPDSGDFFLAGTLSEAIQAARAAHPQHLSFVLRIGHSTTIEMGVMDP